MKVGQNYFPKSSFLSVDKDLSIIVKKLLNNQNLLKLLYYQQKDCLKGQDLTTQQKMSMIGEQIKLVPYLTIDEKCPSYIAIKITDFTPNETNPEFRDCVIEFSILCHPDHWHLGDFALRPYKIAGELDAMLNDEKLTGIGDLHFKYCTDLLLNEQLCGLVISYDAVHGVEDEKFPLK